MFLNNKKTCWKWIRIEPCALLAQLLPRLILKFATLLSQEYKIFQTAYLSQLQIILKRSWSCVFPPFFQGCRDVLRLVLETIKDIPKSVNVSTGRQLDAVTKVTYDISNIIILLSSLALPLYISDEHNWGFKYSTVTENIYNCHLSFGIYMSISLTLREMNVYWLKAPASQKKVYTRI